MAARPRTLPAAIAPVLVGTALAGFEHVFHPLRFVAALLGAIFIQVGTNLSNDYSDARRGADADDRLGPVRVTAGGLVPPRQVLVATYVTFGLAVLCGRLSDRRRGLAAAAGRRRLDPRRRRLHRRPASPTATRGWARCSCSCSSGSSPSPGSYFVQVDTPRLGGVRAGGPGRAARRRDPGRQQHPRHRLRPPGRQAHAGGPARPRAHAGHVRGDRLPRLRARAGDLDVRPAQAVGAAAVADAAARGRGRPDRSATATDGPSLNARARPDRDAPARVLRAAVGRAAAEPDEGSTVDVDEASLARARSLFVSAAPSAFAALIAAAPRTARTARVGYGEAAPLESLRRRRRRRRARGARGLPAAARAIRRRPTAPSCSRACAEAAVLPAGDSRRSTWRSGTWPAAAPARARVAAARRASIRRRSPVNATIAAADRAGAAREAAAARSSRLRLRQGQGRRSATTPGGWRRSARRPGPGCRSASTPTAPGRPRGARRRCACSSRSGSSCARSRSAALAADRRSSAAQTAVAAGARRERARAPGALDAPPVRGRLPEDRSLRRDHGLHRRCRRVRGRAGYEVYLASTLDGPLGIAAALHAATVIAPDRPCGLATLGRFADRRGSAARPRRTDARAGGPGLGDGLLELVSPQLSRRVDLSSALTIAAATSSASLGGPRDRVRAR